ncbi:ABC transporter permease [Gryllotalpicola ginsengisoli]|uniref:ABC transporter permease n=1 Tax=Gryllotalpicola ginsengisoli TaxID=444608 RepID=UPI001FE19F4F|nr:ABC transporter permease [Gryllotalpicola ginsengisoli]
MAVPTVLAVWGGVTAEDGSFTLANFSAFGDRSILKAFENSIVLSLAVAVASAILGAILCVMLLAAKPNGILRVVVDAASSVLAQFGGVMLAFAFIATMGSSGMFTLWLQSTFHVDLNSLAPDKTAGPLLYQPAGMFFPYLYFSIPLMIIAFMPAVEGLRPQWGEAVATLGGGRFSYWRHVGAPVLAPSFFGAMILIFASAFSSFATAAALTNSGILIPVVMQQDLSSETASGVTNIPGVLAIGMIVIMAIVMWAYSVLQRRAARWQR